MKNHTTDTFTGITLAGRSGHWDIVHHSGRITALRPAQTGGGGYVMPLLADIHTHLDKTMTAGRIPRRAQSLFDAIEMMGQDQTRWTDDDLRNRATLALDKAYRHGTALMRSHVDWPTADVPRGWHVLRELAQDWRGRVDLQLSSLTALDDLVRIGSDIVPTLRRDGGILGAFVYRNKNLEADISTLFDLAESHDLHLDFHVDEGLDTDACGIDEIINQTAKRGMGGRVLCGHGCALSVRDPAQVETLLARAADAGVGLTVLPGANSYLQDAGTGRTPRLRGLAPLQEADAAGVPVMLASDNVRDGFFPYGDYDLVEVLRMGVLMGHLPPENWLDAISARPAAWMGTTLDIREGGPANFIHFDATDLNDVISRATATRRVWRDGAVLPPFQGDP